MLGTFLTLGITVFSASVSAFQLSVPESAAAGVPVRVTWSRDDGDPVSFGLMQRSLQDNTIRAVIGVQNQARQTSDSVDITFDSQGQMLLAAIQQTSLDPGEQPQLLSAGAQIAVVPGPSQSAPTSNGASTTSITSSSQTSTSQSTTSSSTALKESPSSSSQSSSSSSASAIQDVSFSVIQLPPPVSSTSSAAITPTATSTTSGSIASSTSTSVSVSSSSDGASSTSEAASATGGVFQGPKKNFVIAGVAVGGVLALLLCLLIFVRMRRAATRRRVKMMEEIIVQRHNSTGTLNTINSFVASDETEGGGFRQQGMQRYPFALNNDPPRIQVDLPPQQNLYSPSGYLTSPAGAYTPSRDPPPVPQSRMYLP